MAKNTDYYEVLGVSREATADEIRKAYRKLARKWHPDVNKDAGAVERFNEITEAYDVLHDAKKRKTYDQFGRAGVGAGVEGFGADAGGFGGWGGAGHHGVDMADVGSIFEELFSSRGGSPFSTQHRQSRGPAPQRGGDFEHTLSVPFMTAALGGEERLRLSVPGGRGTETIHVKIPPGVDTGSKLRVRGKGQAGILGGPAGDLLLQVEVGGHPHFRRNGLDLSIDVPVTLAEAGLGTTVHVPLLKGNATIKVPPGASSGQNLRLRGKGITDAQGRHGDFFAIVQIVAPKNLSERARALLEELSDELQNPRETGPWSPGT